MQYLTTYAPDYHKNALPDWLDILIHVEQIAWVIGRLDLSQAVVVVAVRRLYLILPLIHHHIDIASTCRIRMQCHPVVLGPLDHALVVGRIGINPDNNLCEIGITETERGVS